MEDLVIVEDIAEKTGRSGQAVGHWITGERGPGPGVGGYRRVGKNPTPDWNTPGCDRMLRPGRGR
jgi:hypothetical protein